jgi:type IV pilus assembly protein PilV
MSLKYSRSALISNQGFSLVEVMVSLLIMAIGLLGMTALQNKALQFNQAASIDSQVQYLLTDIAERIRANKGNNGYVISYIEPTPVPAVDCTTNSCTSDEMAIWDLSQWRAKVESDEYMPGGESQIEFDSVERIFIISIRYEWGQLEGLDVTNGKRTVSITTRI